MRIFQEKQQFRQLWFLAILAVVLVGLIVNFYYETEGFTSLGSNKNLSLTVLLVVLIFGGILILELRTKIDSTGVTAKFYPLPFANRHFKWTQIDKIYVRKYSALTEYGGWGIRGFGKAKAYNVSGNYGIQIVTKKNEHFLIGTQKPQDVERVLKKYTEKNKPLNSN